MWLGRSGWGEIGLWFGVERAAEMVHLLLGYFCFFIIEWFWGTSVFDAGFSHLSGNFWIMELLAMNKYLFLSALSTLSLLTTPTNHGI